jgi:hypothetical protein
VLLYYLLENHDSPGSENDMPQGFDPVKAQEMLGDLATERSLASSSRTAAASVPTGSSARADMADNTAETGRMAAALRDELITMGVIDTNGDLTPAAVAANLQKPTTAFPYRP